MIKETARVTAIASFVGYSGSVLEKDETVDFSDPLTFSSSDQSVTIEGKPNFVMIGKPHNLRAALPLSKLWSSNTQDLYPSTPQPEHGSALSRPPGGLEFGITIWPIKIGENPSLPCSLLLGSDEPQLKVSYLGHPLREDIGKLISAGRTSVVLREFLDKNNKKTVYRDILFKPTYLTKVTDTEAILFLELMVIENENKVGKVKGRTPTLFRLSSASRSHADGLVRVNQSIWADLSKANKDQRRDVFRRTAEILALSDNLESAEMVDPQTIIQLNEYIRQGYDLRPEDQTFKLPFDISEDPQVVARTSEIYDFVKSI